MHSSKQWKIILVFTLLCLALTGCARYDLNGHDAADYDVAVQGAIFAGKDGDAVRTTVSFDPKWVTKNDNTKYNKDLAAFAALISDDVYFRPKDVDKGEANRVLVDGESAEEYDWTSLLKHLGFSEARYIESYKAKEYSVDSNDSATLLLAHGVVDGKYDLTVAAVRGCFSIQEWISVYDPGCPGEAYTALTGEHPEWTDPDAFKGLDIAKNRAMEFLTEFMAENDNPDCQDCLLITGHSRGGAIANMIGAEMERNPDVRSYTYTFNTPPVTADESAPEYRTIFNIHDSNDYYVNPLPFGNETFTRYGADLTLPIDSSAEIKAEIAKLKGRDDLTTLSPETKAAFTEAFGRRFPDRASLYEWKTVTQSFDTEQEAAARAETCLALIGSENGLGLTGLCTLSEPAAENGKYQLSMSYCDAAVLIATAKSLAYGEAAHQATAQLFEEDPEACAVLDLLMENAAGVNGGHLIINSYVLSQYVQER